MTHELVDGYIYVSCDQRELVPATSAQILIGAKWPLA